VSGRTDGASAASGGTPDAAPAAGTFHLFVYGTLRRNGAASGALAGCERIGAAVVGGSLYDIDGRYPALLLYGDGAVHGEVWRCPARLLRELDEHEGVADGLFRRVALQVDGRACWTYVAGPRLARQVVAKHRIASGDWTRLRA